MPETPLTRLPSVELPIVQGGMAWVTRHRLASAVSDAGALGVLGAATMEPEELRAEITCVTALTDRPFAVNVPLLSVRPDGTPIAEQLIEVALAERVPIVITGAGSPARFTTRLKEAGIRVLHVVPSPTLARKAEDAGVDAVIAESQEAGGHVRPDGLATFSLIPQVKDAVSCPVVAAGGIADARGALAALALGADGVQLGTRFIATHECDAHVQYKRAVEEASPEAGVLYSRQYHASRGLATPIVQAILELERQGANVDDIKALRGRHRARLGCVEGDLEEGICPSGSAVGLVRERCSVHELIDELANGMRAGLLALDRIFDAEHVAR